MSDPGNIIYLSDGVTGIVVHQIEEDGDEVFYRLTSESRDEVKEKCWVEQTAYIAQIESAMNEWLHGAMENA